jgi:YD repeat-containing protein
MKNYLSELKLVLKTTWLCFLLCISFPNLAQDAVPNFYKEPGLNPNRDFVNQSNNEHIDPFTGALQRHYVDLHIPGNGGFDLKVIRSYNSASVEWNNLASLNNQAGLSGLGWTIHFGRLIINKVANPNPNITTHFCTQPAFTEDLVAPTSAVLELPDGSRQIFSRADSTVGPVTLLSAQRWKVVCDDAQGTSYTVYSPNGMSYDMRRKGATALGSDESTLLGYFTTKITDRNGNSATINYSSNTLLPEINSITTNDERSIIFDYDDSGTMKRRLKSITGAAQTYSYGYTQIASSNKYFLSSTTRPDGNTWDYYYNDYSASTRGIYLMNRVDTPQGGSINYEYTRVNTATDTFGDIEGSANMVTKKSIGSAVWIFNYTPGSTTNYDTTTVDSPAGRTVYQHIGPNRVTNGDLWKIGLLVNKNIGDVQTESYAWEKDRISGERISRGTGVYTKYDDAYYAPRLAQKIITRDGAQYSTTYSNYDGYGNARTITESGTNEGNRTTTLTYYVDTTKWIINQVRDETYPGSSTSRSFDIATGNLTSITRNYVTSNYSYDGYGNIANVTLPGARSHNYPSYFRGIALTEHQPEGITIYRTVNAAGNVTSETNGEGDKTYYDYDDLNRVKFIRYPVGSDVNISYDATSKAAERGLLREETYYDGFGRIIGSNLGGIGRTFGLDAMGRKVFESNPGSTTVGTSYAYDILDRVRMIVNSDGTAQDISYGHGSKTITDERGYQTTYEYRAYGNPDQQFLMSITAPVTDANVLITRNTKDLVTTVTQGGLTRGYGYDEMYYLTSVINRETGTTIYGRNAAGNMISKSVGASGTTIYTYDGQNLLKTVTYPDATPKVTNTYNKTNRLVASQTSAANRYFAYDGNGNLYSETLQIDGKTFNIGHAFNGNDQHKSTTYPVSGNVISYAPDVLGRPTQVSGYVSNVSYWPSGQILQINYANGTSSIYGQNERLWPSSFTTQKPGGYVNSSSYTYDSVGNLNYVNDSIDPTYDRNLSYDAINRLTGNIGSWGYGSTSYTGSGNINYMSFSDFGLLYSYDVNNRLKSISGSKTASYAYDSYGNITTDGNNTYTYDGVPNLRCVNCNKPTTSVQYQYDGTNKRVSILKAGAKTYEMYDSHGKLLFSTDGGSETINYYYLGGKRIAQKRSYAEVSTPSVNPDAGKNKIREITTDLSSAGVNQTVVLTAVMTQTNAAGTVTFYDGNRVIGTATIINGKATLTTTFSSMGNLGITARYFDGFGSTAVLFSNPKYISIVQQPQPATVFSFKNTANGSRLLFTSTSARDTMFTYPGWEYLGANFKAYSSNLIPGLSPVYQFHTDAGDFYYTVSEVAKNTILSTYPQYHYDGIAWYAMPSQVSDSIPLYSFYSSISHMFTGSLAEKNTLVNTQNTWTYSGIPMYVWNSD